MAWTAGGFLAGSFYGVYAKVLPPFSVWLFFSLYMIFAMGILFFFLRRQMDKRDFLFACLLVLCFMLGIARVYVFDQMQDRALAQTLGEPHSYTGIVLDDPTSSSSGKTLGFTISLSQCDETPVCGKVKLYSRPEFLNGIKRGSSVTFTAELNYPAGASFSGGFHTRHFWYRQGIRCSVFTEDVALSPHTIQPRGISYHLETFGRSIRSSVFSVIDQSFGSRTEEAALLKGLLLGNRESFTDEQNEDYIDSGFVHITSASGMHVMFLFGFLSYLFRKLRIPRWMLRLVTFPILLIFAAAAAFTPSICRAVIMLSLMLIATQLQKEPDSLTSLAFAALVLALVNPYILTGYSFLLSFSATLGIIIFSQPIRNKFTLNTTFLNRIADSVSLSLAGTIGIGYFLARFFNRLSWGGILGNILLVPLASFSFIGGLFLWVIGSLVPSLGVFLARNILWIPLWMMNRLADFFSLSFFRFYLPTPPLGFLLLYCVLCGFLYYALKKR
ncbi:MAG: ComEC family competence protein [Clostridia bacterium]|nr:ComEC family competence protein [Clostridia bacterium]